MIRNMFETLPAPFSIEAQAVSGRRACRVGLCANRPVWIFDRNQQNLCTIQMVVSPPSHTIFVAGSAMWGMLQCCR
jgi:hypothetical protein